MEKVKGSQAVRALNEGECLISTQDKTIVQKRDDRFFLRHDQWHTLLPEQDFLELYGDVLFVVYEPGEQGIDEEKDEEYYRWASKYQ